MRIALIGPESSTKQLIRQTQHKYPYIELIPLNYQRFPETLELIKQNEKQMDALLFTGQTPYRYATNFLTPQIPWEYISRSQLSICTSLMQAHQYYRRNTSTVVSMDNFDNTILNQVQQECLYNNLRFQFFNTKFDILQDNYFEKIIESHLYNVTEHNAAFCLTGTQHTFDVLQKKKIPVIKVMPSLKVFQDKLELLSVKNTLQNQNASDKTAVIAVEFTFANHESFNSDLFQLKQTMQALEALSYFAAHTGAAIFQSGPCHYFMTLAANTLLLETDNLRHLSLLSSVMDTSIIDAAAIGIGISSTAYGAKAYAQQALRQALLQKGFCCFAMNDDAYLMGPINLDCTQPIKVHDNNLLAIAEKTGISEQNLQMLWHVLVQYHLDSATPNQLAHYCKLSTRSINRMREKLVDTGYAQITGKKASSNGKGRPGRIIKFNFTPY